MKRRNYSKRMLAAVLSVLLLLTQSTAVFADEITVEEAVLSQDSLTEEDTVEGLPYGLSGMPEDFVLTEEDIKDKETAAACGMADDLKNLTPGVDYADKEIIYMAGSREYAEQVAAAYNARLLDYSYGLAVAMIMDPGLSVAEAVSAGLDPALKLPIVSPNHLTQIEDPIPGSTEDEEGIGDESLEAGAGWRDASLSFDDKAIVPGYKFYEKDPWKPDEQGEEKAGYQWMHDMVGTYEAWQTTSGNKAIRVAVIDAGIDKDHEDLDGSKIEIVKDTYRVPEAKEGVVYSKEAVDTSGHGTHVAGIIAMSGDNKKGGIGIAPGVSLIGIPVATWDEANARNVGIYDDNIIRALNYVAGYPSPYDEKNGAEKGERRADIINMSLGGTGYNDAYQEAITNAYKSGVTVIASMGNEGVNSYHYPAAYEHVIAVSAVDQAGNRAFFSCYGDWADIAAPGVDIFSTWNGHDNKTPEDEPVSANRLKTEDHHDWYASWQGTSMACPVAAGACALYMSAKGYTAPDEMEKILKQTATKVSDRSIGAGIVNVAAMMDDPAKDNTLNTPEVLWKAEGKTEFTPLTDNTTLSINDVIKITAPDNAIAYSVDFTVNGKTPACDGTAELKSEPGKEIPMSTLLHSGATAGKAFTLKAVYKSPQGTVSKVKSIKNITIKQTEPSADNIRICMTGIKIWDEWMYIAQGKSIGYSVTTEDLAGNIKSVKWSVVSENKIDPASSDVSVNEKSGKLTVKKTAEPGYVFRLKAEINNDPNLVVYQKIGVTSPITQMALTESSNKKLDPELNTPVFKNGSLSSVRLFTVDTPETKVSENEIRIKVSAKTKDAITPVWISHSSDYHVAIGEYDEESGDLIIRSNGKAGTAKFTFTALDGTGKKAVLTVKAVVPVSSVNVTAKNGQLYVAPGKSAQFIGTAGNTYGKPSVPKVNWDYKAVVKYTVSDDSTLPDRDVTTEWKRDKLAAISKSGKLTVAKKAADYKPPKPDGLSDDTEYSYDVNIIALAEASDGSRQAGERQVTLSKAVTGVRWFITPDGWDDTKPPVWNKKSGTFNYTIQVGADGHPDFDDSIYMDMTGADYIREELCLASSSNPEIVSLGEAKEGATFKSETEGKYLKYPLYFNKAEIGKTKTVKLTFKSNDGTNKKTVVTLKITGEPKSDK